MHRRHSLMLALIALFVAACLCSSPSTPGPGGGGNPDPSVSADVPSTIPFDATFTAVPPESGRINGADGGEIAAECNGTKGTATFEKDSFPGSIDFKISCLDEDEIRELDLAVREWSKGTDVLLGAIKIEPSQAFNKDILLRIPLITPQPRLAGHYVKVYIYRPDQPDVSQTFEEFRQAQVDEEGRTASVRVDHFTIFALIESIPPTESPSPTLQPTATEYHYTCTDPLGCAVYKPGEAIRIAAMLSPSGPSNTKSLSNDILSGMEDAIRAHPFIGEHAIILDSYDDGCRTDWATQIADKIVSDPSIPAVIGTTCPNTANAIIPTLFKYNLPLISPVNTDSILTKSSTYYPAFFRIAPSDVMEAQVMAKFAREKLGFKTVMIIYDDRIFSADLRDTFFGEFERLGGEITGYFRTPSQGTDMSNLIKTLKSYKQDAYYLALPPEQAAALVAQAYKSGLPMQILGANSLYNNSFLTGVGLRADGMYVPQIQLPVDKYAELYSLDAMDFLLTAISKASILESDGTLYLPRGELQKMLIHMQGYTGKTGTIECSFPGDCSHPSFDIFQWIGLKLQFVGTFLP